MMVTRFDFSGDQTEDGAIVRHRDYAALEARNAALVANLAITRLQAESLHRRIEAEGGHGMKVHDMAECLAKLPACPEPLAVVEVDFCHYCKTINPDTEDGYEGFACGECSSPAADITHVRVIVLPLANA